MTKKPTIDELSKLIVRVKRDQTAFKCLSVFAILVFSLLVWRDFAKLKETLELVSEIEHGGGDSFESMRFWILADLGMLLAPLGILFLHLISTAVAVLLSIYFFAERKTKLLLTMAEILEHNQSGSNVD